MESFFEGYDFFKKHASAQVVSMSSGMIGDNTYEYIDSVDKEIEKMLNDLNGFKGYKTPSNKLKGDIAEYCYADSFNVNAKIQKSSSYAKVDRSHEFASSDVTITLEDGTQIKYGLKFDKTGADTAREQSRSVFERYNKYKAEGGQDNIDIYLKKRGYDDDSVLHDSIYEGQYRVIPKEQVIEATKWLQRKIDENADLRPEQVFRYQETLKMLKTKIEDGNGIESVELTNEELIMLTDLAKNGDVTKEELAKLGITVDGLFTFKDVMQQAFKSGLTAAMISLVLNVAPEILKAVYCLAKDKKIEIEQLKNIGLSAIKGTAQGFITGTISAAIVTACKSGLLGATFKNINPTIVGAMTVLTINAIKNCFLVAKGKMTKAELSNAIIKDIVVSSCSVFFGGITQYFIEIPILGYMIGSFVGSLIGTFAYNVGYSGIVSLCENSGFTMFGLVEQDYTLPDDVIESIGIKIFDYEKFQPEIFKPKLFEINEFNFNKQKINEFKIKILRRGVIGINKIGYIS